MPPETENTDGNFSGGNGALENVNMGSQTERLGALTGIISGLDEDGNDLPPGESRPPFSPTADEKQTKPKPKARKPKAEAEPDEQKLDEADDGQGEPTDSDTGSDDQDQDISADAENEPGGNEPAGDETDEFGSFEEMMEAAGIDPETASDLKFDIKVDGETQQVPYKELVRGYRRQKDLTRGFQELSEVKQQTHAAHQRIADEYRQHVANHVASLKTLEAQITFDEAQIERFRVSSPEAAAAAVARNERNRKVFEQGLKQVNEVHAKQQEAEAAAAEAKARYTYDMLASRHPHLANETGWDKFSGEITDYLTGVGMSQADIDGITDYRLIEVIMDAMKASKTAKRVAAVGKKATKQPNKRTLRKRASTAKTGKRAGAEAERSNAIRQGKKGSLAGFLVDSGMA